jgi:hypothetical protein
LNHGAPVDIRGDSTTGYFSYRQLGSILGTRADASTGDAGDEFDNYPAAMKERLSIRWFYETGQIAGHPRIGSGVPGVYSVYIQGGDGVHPLGDPAHVGFDPHDSVQRGDLDETMEDAGLVRGTDFESEIVVGADLTNANYPSDPTGTTLAIFQRLEAWAIACVGPAEDS